MPWQFRPALVHAYYDLYSSSFFIKSIHRHQGIHRLPIGTGHLPCFGWVVKSSATS